MIVEKADGSHGQNQGGEQNSMTVLICDDEEEFYIKLKNILCANPIFMDSEFIYCEDEKEVFEAYESNEIDIVFMDIEVGEVLGFDIVRKLLLKRYSPKVIYATAYSHYVFESFVGQPLGFVRKSHLEQDLELALNEVNRIFAGKTRILNIRSGTSDYELKLYQISSLEIFGHKMIIHYSDKHTLTVRYTLSKLEKQLAGYDFIRVSRNTLVNLEHIKELSGDRVTMKNGSEVYITPIKIKEIKDAIAEYNRRQGK